jgi:hypothetical protein
MTRSAQHPACALAELGVVTALGVSIEETWPCLVAGDQSRFVARDDLSTGTARRFGAVVADLPAVPASLRHLACRNNELALAAYQQIAGGVEAARRRRDGGAAAPLGRRERSGTRRARAREARHARRRATASGRDEHVVRLRRIELRARARRRALVMRVGVERWAAWTHGVGDETAWRTWIQNPTAPQRGDPPDVSFVPALQRRRCDALARAMLYVANQCCPQQHIAAIPTVFASRHGPFGTTVAILRHIAESRPVSPTRFSHSVHNTQAGLFSIWAGNRAPSVSVSARQESFMQGYVEALCMLHRSDAGRVLFVAGDESIPEELEALHDECPGGYAVALLLARDGGDAALRLDREPDEAGAAPSRAWPDALEFVRWWLSDEPSLAIHRSGVRWRWSRT